MIGLVTCAFMPASRDSRWSSVVAWAVMAMTGRSRSCGSANDATGCQAIHDGIWISIRTSLKASWCSRSMASWPLVAMPTSRPAFLSSEMAMVRLIGMSSTSKTRSPDQWGRHSFAGAACPARFPERCKLVAGVQRHEKRKVLPACPGHCSPISRRPSIPPVGGRWRDRDRCRRNAGVMLSVSLGKGGEETCCSRSGDADAGIADSKGSWSGVVVGIQCRTSTSICPRSVNFIALPTRLSAPGSGAGHHRSAAGQCSLVGEVQHQSLAARLEGRTCRRLKRRDLGWREGAFPG